MILVFLRELRIFFIFAYCEKFSFTGINCVVFLLGVLGFYGLLFLVIFNFLGWRIYRVLIEVFFMMFFFSLSLIFIESFRCYGE